MTDFNKVKALINDIGVLAILKAMVRWTVADMKNINRSKHPYEFQKKTLTRVLLSACVSGIKMAVHVKS